MRHVKTTSWKTQSSFLLNCGNYQLESSAGNFQDFLLSTQSYQGVSGFVMRNLAAPNQFPNTSQARGGLIQLDWFLSSTTWCQGVSQAGAEEGGGLSSWWAVWLDSQSKPVWALWHCEEVTGFERALPPSSPSKTPRGLWSPSSALCQSTH